VAFGIMLNDFEDNIELESQKIKQLEESFAEFSNEVMQVLNKLRISEHNATKVAETAFCVVQDLELKKRTKQLQKVENLLHACIIS